LGFGQIGHRRFDARPPARSGVFLPLKNLPAASAVGIFFQVVCFPCQGICAVVGAPSNFIRDLTERVARHDDVLADPGVLEAQILGTLGVAAVRG
jgi:hypothetical protein